MSVPYDHEIIEAAKSWGLPPWALTGEEPTEAVVSRWVTLTSIFRRLGLL